MHTSRTTSNGQSLSLVTPANDNPWAIAVDNACELHPAFEADYCPSCGTGH